MAIKYEKIKIKNDKIHYTESKNNEKKHKTIARAALLS